MSDYIANLNPECLKKDSHESEIFLLAPLHVIKPEVLKPEQGANVEHRDVVTSGGESAKFV